MAASKELLTEILDGISVVQLFLQQDLGRESLSQSCQTQRQNASKVIETIINKIQNAHPSIRPRVNTPGSMKKPAPPPPIALPTTTTLPEEGEELYEEPVPDNRLPEDYESFEPQPHNIDQEEPQEMYEEMGVTQEPDNQEMYEEPGVTITTSAATAAVPSGTASQEEAGEMYEDPLISSRPSTASLPTRSAENSGSGAEYAGIIARKKEAELENTMTMSTDWGNVYNMPSKGEKVKASALKNVLIKGYLEKLGGRNQRTWQKRYCVLSGPLMYFYEKESSKTYNNFIALLSFTASKAELQNDKSHFGFKLSRMDSTTNKNKDYFFRSASSDVRDKWLTCISKSLNSPSPSPQVPRAAANSPFSPTSGAATLPRMPSQTISTFTPLQRQRTASEGEKEELYEDMAIPEEVVDQDEYVAVSPSEQDQKVELESSEEYVDVAPQQDQIEQEEYEDTSNFQIQPPPPLSPPPGPPSEVFSPPPVPPHPGSAQMPAPRAPAPPPPPPEPEVDTDRIYEQPTTNGIRLEKVFVSLWDFVANEQDELALQRGDLVYVNSPLDSAEWWFGELLDANASKKMGKNGFFPRTYSTMAFEQLS